MPLIEGHYTVDGFYEAISDCIDDAWEDFLEAAACHHNATLMNGPTEEDDDLPFWGSSSSSLIKSKWDTSYILAIQPYEAWMICESWAFGF